jgi:hypothetical protein
VIHRTLSIGLRKAAEAVYETPVSVFKKQLKAVAGGGRFLSGFYRHRCANYRPVFLDLDPVGFFDGQARLFDVGCKVLFGLLESIFSLAFLESFVVAPSLFGRQDLTDFPGELALAGVTVAYLGEGRTSSVSARKTHIATATQRALGKELMI